MVLRRYASTTASGAQQEKWGIVPVRGTLPPRYQAVSEREWQLCGTDNCKVQFLTHIFGKRALGSGSSAMRVPAVVVLFFCTNLGGVRDLRPPACRDEELCGRTWWVWQLWQALSQLRASPHLSRMPTLSARTSSPSRASRCSALP